MNYKLHIYGQVDRVEEERLHFATLADAVESVEGRVTDDHDGWEFKGTKLFLIDFNNGGSNVFHTIKQSTVHEDHVKVHEEPVYTPQ